MDAIGPSCRRRVPMRKSLRLENEMGDAKTFKNSQCTKTFSKPNRPPYLVVPNVLSSSLWNILLITFMCDLFTNAQGSDQHPGRNVLEQYAHVDDPSSPVPDFGDDDDFRRHNFHLFAVTGHHFNRSLTEELKAYDPDIISDGDVIKVHFPRQDLPGSQWLIYNEQNDLLQGVPLPANEGSSNFYFTIVRPSELSQSALTLPCTVEVLSDKGAVEMQQKLSGHPKFKIDAPLICFHHDPVTIATLSLEAESHEMSHAARLDCVRKLESFFDIPSKDVTFHPSPDSLVHDGPVLSGPGNVPKIRTHRGDRDATAMVMLSWTLGCSSDIIGDIPSLDKLETSALDGSLARAIGYDIAEWQIVNRNLHFRRILRKKRKANKVPSSANILYPRAARLSSRSNDDVRTMDVPTTEETLATLRNGRTRVAVNAIHATPVPNIPVLATKVPTSPMDRSAQIVIPSTPRVQPPVSSPPPDFLDTNEPPMLLFGIEDIKAIYGTYMEYRIPNDVFYDAEDEMTWNLNLEVKDTKTGADIADLKVWVKFDAKAKLLYGVPDETAEKQQDFVLVARDSGGKSASTTFPILVDMDNPPKPVSHNFTFYFSESPGDYSVNDLYTIFGRKLAAGLAKEETENMPGQIVMLSTGVVESTGQRFFTWFDRSLNDEDLCQSKGIKQEADLMIGTDANAGRNRPQREFANKFKPEFRLKTIWIRLLGPCYKHTTTSSTTTTTTTTTTATTTTIAPIITTQTASAGDTTATPLATSLVPTTEAMTTVTATPSPPQTGKPLPQIQIEVGKVTHFTLPQGSFIDPSGDEKELEILLNSDAPSWVALDAKSRTFYFTPTQQEFESLQDYNTTHKQWKGFIKAKNVYDVLSKPLAVDVFIQKEKSDAEKKPNHKFSIVIKNYDLMTFTALDRLRLIQAISAVFGDEDSSQLYIYPIRKGSVVFSWHNTSLAYIDPCPFQDISALSEFIFDQSDIRQEAKKMFQAANFTIERMELTKPKWCKKDKAGPDEERGDEIAIAGRQGKSTTIIIIAVIVVCLVVLIVILVVKCRMGQTAKDGKDDTKKLQREEEAVALANPESNETPRIKKGVPIIFKEEIAMEPNGKAHATPSTPLVTHRNNGHSRSPAIAENDENIREETPFTSPSSHHPMTPPTPIMSGRPPPPYVKSR